MKYIAAFLIIILAGGIYIYNTTRFQALFKADFYDDICYMPFDVTKKGEKITIPLKYKPKSSGGGPLKPSSAETGRRLTPKMVRMGTA